MKDLIRLSKLMSERGICSRREADRFIEQGWVKVDGEVIDQLGTRVRPDAEIQLLSQAESVQAKQATILLNKPLGFVSSQPEPGYTPAIELLKPENQDPKCKGPRLKQHHLKKLAVAGRLDINSKGLLVFTQDGRVARSLIGENTELEKEYLVRVSGHVDEDCLARLRYGLSLDGKKLKPAVVEELHKGQLRFILKQGKKRQIRRMCEAVGLEVTALKRVRVGKVRLGTLEEGCWRWLRPGERFN